ncbi:hypothetical protein E5335_02010 [Coriobacteriaceae bacterium]|nr:hypothetical protein [Atopobiaceae bacterium FL090493]TGY60814.1 hypothetical protein E5335_02010 [Coriobacteriaceae bacterium]
MADKNDRSLTPADRRRQKREAKEAKARERRIRARQGDRRLFPKVSKKAATAFVAVVAVLFVLSVFWRLGPGSQAPRVQGTDAPAVAKKGATMIYKSGSYTVGTNLDAGQYKFLAAGGQTAAVSVDGGDAASFTTQCWLELSDGQKVEVSGATFASGDDISATDAQEVEGTGIYKVGTDCPAARYAVTSDGSGAASYAVLDSDAPGSEPVASGSVDGSTEVQVADGQYLELRGCVATVLG